MEGNMDESEKKFEQWFRTIETGDDDKWELPAYKSPEWNAYLLRRQLAHGAWNASRAAIEIELDSHTEFEIEHIASPIPDGYAKGWIDGRNYGEKQIRKYGIKVKE